MRQGVLLAMLLSVAMFPGCQAQGETAEKGLLDHVVNQVERRLPVAGVGETRQFKFWNQAAPDPERIETWLGKVDLSFIGAGVEAPDGQWERRGNAVLVTQRHVLMASHHRYADGDRLLFVSGNGEVAKALLIRQVEIQGTDITVGLIDWVVNAERMQPASLLTRASLERCLAQEKKQLASRAPLWVPVLGSNRDRRITLQVLRGIGPRIIVAAPMDASSSCSAWQPYYVPPESGTSGSPLFWLIEGKAVLLGHYSTTKPDSGPFYGWHLRAIEQAVATTGINEPLHLEDLSLFEAERENGATKARGEVQASRPQ